MSLTFLLLFFCLGFDGGLTTSPSQQLSSCQSQLDRCQQKLTALESDSYLGRVCQWVGKSAAGRDLLKDTLGHGLLEHEGGDDDGDGGLRLVLDVSASELVKLRRFAWTDEGEEKEIHAILKNSFKTGQKPPKKPISTLAAGFSSTR